MYTVVYVAVVWCMTAGGADATSFGALRTPRRHVSYAPMSTVRVSVLLPQNESYMFALGKVGPVVELAVRNITRSLLHGWAFNVTYRDTRCQSPYATIHAVEDQIAQVNLFLGPACDYVAASVARLLKFWDIPLVTAGAMAYDFWDKTTPAADYYLMTRVGLTFTGVSRGILALSRRFKWKRLLIFYETRARQTALGEDYCFLWAKAMAEVLRREADANFEFQGVKMDFRSSFEEQVAKVVSTRWAIVLVCAEPDTVRQIMLAALNLGMITSGEYAFFSMELYASPEQLKRAWWRANSTEEENELAALAYEALFIVTTPQVDHSGAPWLHKINNIARSHFNRSYDEEYVNSYALSFYDGLLLYALALNETLGELPRGSALSGAQITKRMWNRTFRGLSGTVRINSEGDREGDFAFLDMNPVTKLFETFTVYSGETGLFTNFGEALWTGGRLEPPLDTPECGYDKSLCPEEEYPRYVIILSALTICMLIGFIAFFVIHRRMQLEAELASMTWRVKCDDVITQVGPHNLQTGTNLQRCVSRLSLSSCSDAPALKGQTFISTGVYKGTVVAIRTIEQKKIELSRTTLLELKNMKDLQHDHIVRFIGVCIDVPHCAIFTEYCPRGSLQDVLENDEIHLDWMFRYSLMLDVVKGISYLHTSLVRSHGNLKSSNCVVDSRFVLKLTDFGLHFLRPVSDDITSHAYWRSNLWVSPELLRLSTRPPEGTQKGDVYSFAIIAHEIVRREGVFYLGDDFNLSPKEICEKVRSGKTAGGIFRPKLDTDSCSVEIGNIIRKCWAEDPRDRPDVQQLKMHLTKLNREWTPAGNILDNLLRRMEQYANNLEKMVEERTHSYLEEKQKAEHLLYQLLPKSVASDLICGRGVSPESYDGVTIYFSDIVGFTSISAESTPMQVVDLLNDLYTCFDSILENYNVYKVETIGDAYMVVSGLPVRNGNRHAAEIARMALALRSAVFNFSIRHRPSEQLKLRIGIHTGPCAAGVVGLRMPRYCLFGDTVNTASRMESTGEALKIHVSKDTKETLDEFGTFKLELRGEIQVKGKGIQTTYWLLEELEQSSDQGTSESMHLIEPA